MQGQKKHKLSRQMHTLRMLTKADNKYSHTKAMQGQKKHTDKLLISNAGPEKHNLPTQLTNIYYYMIRIPSMSWSTPDALLTSPHTDLHLSTASYPWSHTAYMAGTIFIESTNRDSTNWEHASVIGQSLSSRQIGSRWIGSQRTGNTPVLVV